MKLTKELRELLRDYQLLDRGALHRMRVVGGLWGSMRRLQELSGLFWDLNSRLDEIDKQQEAIASEIDKDPDSVDPLCPDIPTSELLAAELALGDMSHVMPI
jgi:hypothetical protein